MERYFAMKTRMFDGIGVVALALAIVGLVVFAQKGQPQEKKSDHMEHNEMMQACAKACSECQRACDSCATHCAHRLYEGKKEHLATLTICQDCAAVCSAAAQIVARAGRSRTPSVRPVLMRVPGAARRVSSSPMTST